MTISRQRPLLFLLLLLLGLSALQPLGLFAETLTVATYNVQNYLPTMRNIRGDLRSNYPKPAEEIIALRANIKAINADIIAIQEMGALPYLKELQRDLKREGVDYPYAELLDSPFDPDRHLAVLSRRPFTHVGRHTDLSFKYYGATDYVKRGLLEVRVATEGGELTLFVVHLKSRLTEPDHPDDLESARRRAGEAEAVRDCVLKIFPNPSAPDARFLILGDCNDTRANRPLRALSVRGKTQIATPLPGGDTRGEVWTYYYAKQDTYTRFDHILVSPALKNSVQNKAVAIYDGPDVMAASYPRPIYVRLELGKPGKPAVEERSLLTFPPLILEPLLPDKRQK